MKESSAGTSKSAWLLAPWAANPLTLAPPWLGLSVTIQKAEPRPR